ncbi:MAG: putative baseplate assembly protein, partial [Betaproteobacteria bacterium]
MPLVDYLPNIDDRRYDDIVSEIRTRIARYAPEWRPGEAAWTDVNDNDPGITFAQVFAWQAEMLLYRMNRVPLLNYIKFLELLGIELRAAEPARAEVTFPVKDTHPDSTVLVAERTQLTADPGDGSPPLVFETVRGLVALRARLDAVLASDGSNYTDVTAPNTDATTGYQPFGPQARASAELALGFTDTAPLPAGALDLAFVATGDADATDFLACATPVYAPATLAWEYWDGARWQCLDVLKDETAALTRSGHVVLRIPAKGVSAKAKLTGDPKEPARMWLRARVKASQYERAPTLLAVRTNTVAVEQAETIRDEVLGGSDGSRNQRFQLGNKPVVRGSLALEVEQSDEGYEPWTEVEDLSAAAPHDMVYVLDRATGEIRTGDGVNGDIPVAYVANPTANVVAREYRTGGGKRGNVAARAIDTLVTSIAGIDDNAVGNLQAAHDGRDEESAEEAMKRAPQSIRSRERAVTADDFEYLAAQAGNVRRAKALAMFHPQFPTTQVPGAVSVIIVPDSDEPAPVPSEGLMRTVCAYLDARRLLTTELYVMKPSYQLVSVRTEVVVAEDADLAEVSQRVAKTLLDYFHPLRGGESGAGWPFGESIYYSRVYQRVFGVDGVASVTTLVISVDGDEQPECKDVPIARHALVYSTDHAVTAH